MPPTTRQASPPAAPEAPLRSEPLARSFEDLGLTTNEARVLIALLRLGTASTTLLASEAGVPRTTIYQVLEGLADRRLAERLPGADWPAVWTSPGREAVLDRLVANEEERIAAFRNRANEVRELLVDAIPDEPAVAMPYVHLLRGAGGVKRTYDELLNEASDELLMFTRGPFAYRLGKPNTAVLDLLGRGVRARVLYQESEWEHPDAEGYRQEAAIYARAGVESRLADSLPVKLVIVDRKVALISMSDPSRSNGEYPATLLVEHAGVAELLADAFERRWAEAKPNPSDAPAVSGVVDG